MKELGWAMTLALVLVAAVCDPGSRLDTRTFELEHLEPERAYEAVEPYVFTDRQDAPGKISIFPNGISVRETEDNLAKIERVLQRLDRPSPGVRLRFQVIRADGAERDPRIAGVDSLLRDLFRYEGYRLVEELQIQSITSSESYFRQRLNVEGRDYDISGEIVRLRRGDGGGTVQVELGLNADPGGNVLATTLTVPLGETVVLGSSRPDREAGALILTVRPELVPADGSGGR